jgi:hypothetical protein
LGKPEKEMDSSDSRHRPARADRIAGRFGHFEKHGEWSRKSRVDGRGQRSDRADCQEVALKGTFSMVEGKLQAEWETTVFEVDPDTLKRTPRKDKMPQSIFKEFEQKFSR